MIPEIDIASLFGPPGQAQERTDRAIMAAAEDSGFMVVAGLPASVGASREAREELLRFFSLPLDQKMRLARQKFAPENPNVYRGYFPPQEGQATYKEGIDLGPDLAWDRNLSGGDPLMEATPRPAPAALPGWCEAASSYHAGMERVGAVLLAAIARGLGLRDDHFAPYFDGGISTLRLLRYPPRKLNAETQEEAMSVLHKGRRWQLAGQAHVDSGFVTLLQQHGVSGLQAQLPDGSWHDVPPCEGGLVINFGKLLERWTAGRIKATRHRILANDGERFSIPFFYEPRADARIEPLPLPLPLPLDDGSTFTPFVYGDHLWAAMTRFVEFHGLEHLRPVAAV